MGLHELVTIICIFLGGIFLSLGLMQNAIEDDDLQEEYFKEWEKEHEKKKKKDE